MDNKGQKLKELREKCGYTQEQVANFLEVDQSFVAKIEKDIRNISFSLLDKLLVLYGIDYKTFANETIAKPISYAYRSKLLTNSELKVISEINLIILNLEFMEKIDD
jgi:transcriptional regulator with XRE-family HTH domain